MSPLRRLAISRDNWRQKASKRRIEVKALVRRCAGLEKKVVSLKAEIQALKSCTAEPILEPADKTPDLRAFAVFLAVVCGISFRATPRVLSAVSTQVHTLSWIPHFTSVTNWSLRLGLALLEQVVMRQEKWVAIIDCSVSIGFKKVLVVLRVAIEALEKRKNSAVTLEDCECIEAIILEEVNGPIIEEKLAEVFAKAGNPAVIIRDGGKDLEKGIKLWKVAHCPRCEVVYDLGHRVARILKAYLEKLAAFQNMAKLLTEGARKIGLSDYAFLKPPALRMRGQYMSLTKLFDWAQRVAPLFSGTSKWRTNPIAAKLAQFLPGFGAHRPFLVRLSKLLKAVEEVLSLLKKSGLNQKTAAQARCILEGLSKRNPVRKKMEEWLTQTLQAQCRLSIGQMPLIVSSDIIESLFGKFKALRERGGSRDFNRLVALIPALCGQQSLEKIQQCLLQAPHTKLKVWQSSSVPQTQGQLRRKIFPPRKKQRVPKMGSLSSA